MMFYHPVRPEAVHGYVLGEMKRSMRAAMTGEFSYCPGRLPMVWENLHRGVEQEALFEWFEERALVRIEMEPDDLSFDDLVGDTYDVDMHENTVPGGARTIQAQEREFSRKLDVEGQWSAHAEFVNRNGDWELGDGIGGFVGNDFEGSGYEPDVKSETLRRLFEDRDLRMPDYFASKTGAWMAQCIAIWEMYAAMHGEEVA